ncbi:hypothetical protein Cylst_0666 [Cylindrospermum stagnale PCC 7417]|uniref:eCIS core domain-containing protein n=1 Tax=Cylindrospermum stagnale PCC 7417 TaxID=56107 RepID=K9WRI4_9NOST|nr:DUF4157 domain-containing protein [Cylindrospermum stagnale]AFZ22995.1 hypothetical protein Cylst_0666 [Cylindrospermum stagnale PCC 7417]
MYKPKQPSQFRIPNTAPKTSKNKYAPDTFTVPPKGLDKSAIQPERRKYSSDAVDRIAAKMTGETVPASEHEGVEELGLVQQMAQAPAAIDTLPIQAKLTVGAPGDRYEQEADQMACQVMSMPDTAVQREMAPEEQIEQQVQTKSLANAITPIVQRASLPAMDGSLQTGGNIETRLNSSKSGGSPLADDVRGFMEPRFGTDFSQVRVHTGEEAIQMNRELGAQAFAHGSNIYFGAGKAPGNNELTAHELTHVVQQKGQTQLQEPMKAELTISSPKDAVEQEAHEVAHRVISGEQVEVGQTATANIHGNWLSDIGKAIKDKVSDGSKAVKKPAKDDVSAEKLKAAISAKKSSEVLSILANAPESEFTLLVQVFTPDTTRWFLANLPPAKTVANQDQIIQKFKSERSVEGVLGLKDQLYWAGGSGSDPNDNYQIKTSTTRPKDALNDTGGNTNTNDFALWVRGGKEPTNASKMNCWEAVLYGAYLGGVVSKDWLVKIHEEAAKAGTTTATALKPLIPTIEAKKRAEIDATITNARFDRSKLPPGFNSGVEAKAQADGEVKSLGAIAYSEVLKKHLGFNTAKPITPGKQPKRGDIVFFGNSLEHVAISLGPDSKGKNEVMSLWILPLKNANEFNSKFQRTTIEEINGQMGVIGLTALNVTFAPNPF